MLHAVANISSGAIIDHRLFAPTSGIQITEEPDTTVPPHFPEWVPPRTVTPSFE